MRETMAQVGEHMERSVICAGEIRLLVVTVQDPGRDVVTTVGWWRRWQLRIGHENGWCRIYFFR